jgi:pyruvate dehydrogenase E2 component (dihydrolipoamide acetyltransferase)
MAFQFIMPDIGEGVVEGEIVRWHVKTGDAVKEDQTLVEIMTDKATVQIPSPKAGTVGKLFYKEGDVAKVGKPLLDIETGAASAAPSKSETPKADAPKQEAAPQERLAAKAAPREEAPTPMQSAPREAAPRETSPRDAQNAQAQASNVQPLVASTGAREVLATPAVRKLARDEGVEIAKVPGTGPYGRITREDVLRAASSGGQVISFTPPQQKPQEAPARVANAPQQESRWDREQPRSNEARAEQPAPPAAQAPSPNQNQNRNNNERNDRPERNHDRQDRQERTDRQDRQERGGGERNEPPRREERQPQQPPQAPQTAPALPQPAPQAPAQVAAQRTGGETRQPIRGLRKRISEKMHQSKSTAAHFTYVEEFDLTELVKLRETINKKLEPQGVKLSYLPFIMKAVVAALRRFPTINAHVDDAKQELVIKHDYNLGIATQTDDGLMVPVVRNVDQKSMIALSKEVASVSEKARKRQASSQELSGSTFTITSLGQVGGMMATPVINYPEVAIMGVHQIKKKPWVVADKIEIRDIANFSASFDHRLIDGYIGAQFITEVKRLLEDPQTLFLEI